jgi:ferric-dicitrate binding protein FerR (iron transport regulator)
LEGEAFFDVEKGKSFKVITDVGTVIVLGTEFNVKQRQDYFEVVCYEGLVLVETSNESLKLPAGKSFRIIKGEVFKSETQFESPTWTEDISTFHSVPFEMIIAEFERQYDVKIKVKKQYLDELYTGSFTHTDIETALKSIALPFNLEASKKGKNISLDARE